MALRKPIFVDLNGATARIDPPSGPTSYTKLTISTPIVYNDAGHVDQAGQLLEMYMSREITKNLADALFVAVSDDVQKLMGDS